VPWQLFGYGRSDRSTKLTRGLISETPAGFRSRRGLSYDDSAPVTPHNAPFPTYKTPRVHHAARWLGGLVPLAARAQQAAVAFAEAAAREFDSSAFAGVPASLDLEWLRGCVDYLVRRDA
jgi:hypothetical protein